MTQFTPTPTEEGVPAEDNQQLENASRKAKKPSFFRLPENITSQARNAIRVIALFTAASLSVLGFLAFQAARTPSLPQLWTIVGITAFVIAFMFAGLVVARGGRHERGIWLAFVPWLLLLVVIVAFVSGMGLVFMAVSIAIIIPISGVTLPSRQATMLNIVGAVTAAFILLVDVFTTAERIAIPGFDTVAIVVVGALVLFFGYTTLRQFGSYSLRAKLLVAFIGVTVIATGALGAYMLNIYTNNLQDNLDRELTAATVDRASRIGDLFNEQINALTTLSLNETLLGALEAQNSSYEGSAAAIQRTLDAKDAQWRRADEADNNNDFLVRANLNNTVAREVLKYQRTFPANVEVFITDVYGGLAGTTNRTSDYYQADEGWWQAAYNDGEGAVYIAEPEFDESAGAIGVNIALPVRDQDTGEITGILRTTYIVSPLTTILAEKVGQTGEADLYFPGEVVSHIHEGEFGTAEAEEFEALQAVFDQGLVEMEYEGTLSVVSQAQVQTLEGNPAVDNLGWVVVLHQQQQEAFAPITAATQGFVIVLLIIVALAAAAAFFSAQYLIRPILRLTSTAEEVSAGDLDSRAEVTTADEVGTLATAFNTMTSQLQETLAGLEQRVAERTQNLELAAEVGRSVSQVRALDLMLEDACDLILKEFDLYYVQVYLTDPGQRNLILEAGTGDVGAQLRARGHSLQFNTGSLNGRAAVEKRTVVIADTAESAVFRPNPLLPDTRGEMAVPLIVGDNVVGVLDMQTTNPGKLNEEVLPAFEALAGQLAVAVQNANLVAQAEEARAEVEVQARRLVRASWDEHLDAIHKPEQFGFVFDRDEITLLVDTEEAQLPGDGQAVSAPISLTGEALGSLVVEIDEEHQNEQTSELVETVARQVAQQLENLRLLEDADRFRFEAEQASRRQTREGWQEYMQSRTEDGLGYLYDQNEVRPHSNGKDDAEAVTLPLKAREETVGKLSVKGLEPDDKESFDLANAVAERLGTHIENLRLSEQTKQSLALTDELYDISQSVNEADSEANLLEALTKPAMEAGAMSANLMYIDVDAEGNPEWTEIVADWRQEGEAPIPVGTRFYLPDLPFSKLWMADPDNPLLVSDVNTDDRLDEATRAAMQQGGSRAIALIPLTRGQDRVGLVTLNWDQPHEFGQHEKETYAAIIGLASPAVHGRRLFEQAQKQAERETMLNTINQKIQSATSVEAVLQIAARELGHALGAPMTIAQLSMKDQE